MCHLRGPENVQKPSRPSGYSRRSRIGRAGPADGVDRARPPVLDRLFAPAAPGDRWFVMTEARPEDGSLGRHHDRLGATGPDIDAEEIGRAHV